VTLAGTGNHVISAAATDTAGNTATSNAITLTLSSGDVIIDHPGQLFLNGTSGSDHIVIHPANLLVNAGDGDDILSLIPGPRAHLLIGGNGIDTLDLSATTAANSVDLSLGFATGGQIGVALLNSIENVTGGSGNDTIIGNGVANRLDGGAGRDTIRAGNGNDTIIGGAGNDTLTGGGGSDTFIFRPNFGKDVITDFQIGGATAASTHDVLDLRGLGFRSIQDVLDHTDPGANAVIHAGVDDITLQGVTKAQLTAHQFDFVV
jgi:Ca2+-binding RTX toxin-like protein